MLLKISVRQGNVRPLSKHLFLAAVDRQVNIFSWLPLTAKQTRFLGCLQPPSKLLSLAVQNTQVNTFPWQPTLAKEKDIISQGCTPKQLYFP